MDSGFKQNTIGILQSVVRPAFEMAVEDDIIRKNPFKFKLSDVVPKDAYVRNALTREQQEKYLQFVQDYGGNYYDDIVILMGTGLRVSELYGLTRADIDFERHCIHVRRQLCRTAEKPYFVTPPKTKSGIRNVPMTDTVRAALLRVVKARASTKVEALVDGCSGFLFLDKSGMPKVAMHLENYMRGVQGKFEKAYGKPVPRITPHVLRHTFCTNVQQAGLDVKSLQYLMGHSNASVTLDVYTHSSFESVERAFEQRSPATCDFRRMKRNCLLNKYLMETGSLRRPRLFLYRNHRCSPLYQKGVSRCPANGYWRCMQLFCWGLR